MSRPVIAWFALLALACEESPKPTAEAASTAAAAASAAAAPTPPPAPAEAPKPARVKKKPEDCPKDSKVVSFSSKPFEDELRKKLQKAQGDITLAELKTVKSLNLSQATLDELDVCVFPHMTGLKELFLGPSEQLDDLSPIARATKLESLRASINQVRDISPLSGMTKLDRLDLGRTQVSDLKPLSEMTVLTELQLDDTPVEDLKPLEKLTKLERLSIQRTRVKDVSVLKNLKSLKFLYVSGSPAADDAMGLAAVRSNGAKVIDQ
jgi:internalin A